MNNRVIRILTVAVILLIVSSSKTTFAAIPGCAPSGGINQTSAVTVNPANGSVHHEIICYTDNEAWYKFDLATGEKATIDLKNFFENLNIKLLSPTSAVISTSNNTGTTNEKIVYTAGPTGTYYLQVLRSGSAVSEVLTYVLTVLNSELPPAPTVCTSTADPRCHETPDDLCTNDVCNDPGIGSSCSHPRIVCPVGSNPCIIYGSCNPATGCVTTPKPKVNGYWTSCSVWGSCNGASCNSNGEPTPGTQTCLFGRTCAGQACGGAGCDPATRPSATQVCYPTSCPYQYPTSTPTPEYQKTCLDTATTKWYAGDPNPLALICVVVRLLNVLVLAVGAVFVMIVFLSAIKFAMAQGDPKALQGAKQGLTVAIIGVLIVVGVFAILTILRNVLGLKYQLLTNPFDVLSDNFAKLMLKLNISW